MNLRQSRPLGRRAAKRLACACGLASLFASACTEPDFVDASALEERNLLGQDAIDGSIAPAPATGPAHPDASAPDSHVETIAHPDGAYAVDATAEGTGCAPGSWSLALSQDGKALELDTDAFDLEVDDRSRVSSKHCLLRYRLRSAGPSAFAVRSARYPNYSFLEQGVQASFSVEHFFSGQPATQTHADVTGAFDDVAVAAYEAQDSSLRWSPCGTTHDLYVNLSARLQNSDPPSVGYVRVTSLDAQWHPPTVIALEQRPCGR